MVGASCAFKATGAGQLPYGRLADDG